MKHIKKIPTQGRSGFKAASLSLALLLAHTPVMAQDALNENAVASERASTSLLMDLDRVGSNLIAVGERGHILLSGDQTQSWQQVPVPVRVTLTASYFVDDQYGWAVGHDGVVLRTLDGGRSWQKLLDGNQANQIGLERAKQLMEALERRIADATEQEQGDLELELESLTFLWEDAESFVTEGPSRPFLDLWFKDRNEGFIVGAFGLILHTRDGGNSWEAWFDHLDNPDNFHLNAIRQVGDRLYLAAEAGTLYRSDDWGQSWELLDSPYEGSFFGVVGSDDGRVIAYGLRGNAYQSNDWGDQWAALDTGVDTGLYGATMLDNGTVVLVGDAGMSVFLDADGNRIGNRQTRQRLPLSSVIAGDNKELLTVGLTGVQSAPLVGGSD
ncbi:hypothetical protein DV711_02005 [Motiliproteus coralliicola]|uniref:Photosynthesis system II assembly factor Ycf48/Hcf136-like domain-containing protein n=1 Tax=Motiliproteus coralliicola TaxID=2283196 RepID=A0A369WV28_9GAMM|nr:YCF48-related protein [Motiliproteus coralliicola]RDE24386.1 hypothetical protein DV711_02005 [Motiliproteus coralliicola]